MPTNPPMTLVTPSKWILCGEHAVLRGHSALVFPNPACCLTLTYQSLPQPLTIHCQGHAKELVPNLFRQLIQATWQLTGQKAVPLTGKIELSNAIPVGIGLGFSASLCITVLKWMRACALIHTNDLKTLGRQLENNFHGTSSGVDIACVYEQQPLLYQQGVCQPIELTWQPHVTLTNSDIHAKTQTCIEQVNALWAKHPNQAQQIDAKMQQASLLCCKALQQEACTGRPLLQQALKLANTCFNLWGLCPTPIKAMQEHHQTMGALASKLSGAGNGGLILTLWPKEPPHALPNTIALTTNK
jgi:mevalonate kinase